MCPGWSGSRSRLAVFSCGGCCVVLVRLSCCAACGLVDLVGLRFDALLLVVLVLWALWCVLFGFVPAREPSPDVVLLFLAGQL